MSTLKEQALRLKDYVVEVRRELHRCPEPGLMEFKTAKIISRRLSELGIDYEYVKGQTSIVGIIHGGVKGKTVGIRADMDALPITEAHDVPYASANSGWMHACGHDAHVAILLGTAKLLSEMSPMLRGSVKLFFQAAEETVGGADTMVKSGCMKNPDVDAVLGLHVYPSLECGQVQTRYGALNGSSDSLHITVRGKASHGAYPEAGTDAIAAAAQLITALQTIASRNTSPLDSVVLSIGTIHGGTAENILADEVQLTGTLRTLLPATREKAKNKIKSMVDHVCAALGATGNVEIDEGYCALINNEKMVDLFLDTVKKELGSDCVSLKEQPSLGVEDFSYFLDAAPGMFFHLGCGNAKKGITSALHTSSFDLDEDCLCVGVLMEAAMTLRILQQEELL